MKGSFYCQVILGQNYHPEKLHRGLNDTVMEGIYGHKTCLPVAHKTCHFNELALNSLTGNIMIQIEIVSGTGY